MRKIEKDAIREITRELNIYLSVYDFDFKVSPDYEAYDEKDRIWCQVEIKYKHLEGWYTYLVLEYNVVEGVRIETTENVFEDLKGENLWRTMFFDAWKDLLMAKRLI